MAEMKSGSTAEDPYLLGMDIGTGGVRVGIFDRKGTPPAWFSGIGGSWSGHHEPSVFIEQEAPSFNGPPNTPVTSTDPSGKAISFSRLLL